MANYSIWLKVTLENNKSTKWNKKKVKITFDNKNWKKKIRSKSDIFICYKLRPSGASVFHEIRIASYLAFVWSKSP